MLSMYLSLFASTYSGTCGDNLTWTLDTESGILTISGTGAMYNFEYPNYAPWYSSRSSIKTVIIEDGVFIGGNCGIYEGTLVGERAVIGSGVVLTKGTALFDATTGDFVPKSPQGQTVVPAGAVVVAGSRPISSGPAREAGIHLYTPVIVKYRDGRTEASVELEKLLR